MRLKGVEEEDYIYIGDGFVKSGDDDEMFGRFKRGPRGGGRQNNEELASVLYIPRLVSFRLSPRVSFECGGVRLKKQRPTK